MSYPRRVSPPATTYHLVSRQAWEAADPRRPYLPASFPAEGFVHCTDGAEELAATANRYFSAHDGELLALVIDRQRLTSPVRYEDPRNVYPHIYGPVQREAITGVRPMQRDSTGAWLPPRS